MKTILTLLFLSIASVATATASTGTTIDRYTVLQHKETESQANPLSVVINVKFARNITTVKQAIDYLLIRSGYTLNTNYESEKINNFKLPEVHKSIGPISLKRAIKILLGSAWNLQINELDRSVQIVQVGTQALQILNPDAKTMLQNVIKEDVLDEIVAVAIDKDLLPNALKKILPNGWEVKIEDKDLTVKTVNYVFADEYKRKDVIETILKDINARGFFYKKLKLLVVRSIQKVIK